MLIASAQPSTPSAVPPRELIVGEPGSPVMNGADPRFAQYKVIRRNGSVVAFEPSKITIAMTKAFLAINGGQGAASARVREQVAKLTDGVVAALVKRKPEGGAIHIEEIQDQVELQLMRGGEHEVARAYVLYREKRSQERAHAKSKDKSKHAEHAINVTDNGVKKPLDLERLTALVKESCADLADVEPERILKATLKDLYDGVAVEEVRKGVVLSARALIEKEPAYSYVTARLLLDALRFEALGEEAAQADMAVKYPEYFPRFVKHGVKIGLLNEALLHFDMKKLGAALAAGARPAVRLSRPANALRPLLPRRSIRGRPPLRAAAVLLHARGDGPRVERGRSGSARHRVLQRAVDVRLHVEHAHALQRRHAPLATVVVLSDHGVRRSRRHLRSDQGKRASVQVRGRIGERLDQRARDGLAHQGHQRQDRRAWCRS